MSLAPSMNFDAFSQAARRGNVIPVSAAVAADTVTPVSAFLRLAANATHAFLLESVEGGEKLARFSGIVLSYPELSIDVEGHTDSTGSDDFNQQLSEQRASTVREYLMSQGLSSEKITAKGLGKSMPVADNSTSTGRQKNRRVEIIVSGRVIGTQIGI